MLVRTELSEDIASVRADMVSLKLISNMQSKEIDIDLVTSFAYISGFLQNEKVQEFKDGVMLVRRELSEDIASVRADMVSLKLIGNMHPKEILDIHLATALLIFWFFLQNEKVEEFKDGVMLVRTELSEDIASVRADMVSLKSVANMHS